MSKHSSKKEKKENVLFKQIPRSRAYELHLACEQKVSKSGFSKNLVGSNPRTSFLLSNKFKHSFVFLLFLEHLEINKRLLKQHCKKNLNAEWLCCSRQTGQNLSRPTHHQLTNSNAMFM